RATPCLAGDSCEFRCFFAGDDALVPHPCKIAPPGTGSYRIGDMTLRASQTGGRARWIDGVESSPVFQALLARHVRPDGYEVWREKGCGRGATSAGETCPRRGGGTHRLSCRAGPVRGRLRRPYVLPGLATNAQLDHLRRALVAARGLRADQVQAVH